MPPGASPGRPVPFRRRPRRRRRGPAGGVRGVRADHRARRAPRRPAAGAVSLRRQRLGPGRHPGARPAPPEPRQGAPLARGPADRRRAGDRGGSRAGRPRVRPGRGGFRVAGGHGPRPRFRRVGLPDLRRPPAPTAGRPRTPDHRARPSRRSRLTRLHFTLRPPLISARPTRPGQPLGAAAPSAARVGGGVKAKSAKQPYAQ